MENRYSAITSVLEVASRQLDLAQKQLNVKCDLFFHTLSVKHKIGKIVIANGTWLS